MYKKDIEHFYGKTLFYKTCANESFKKGNDEITYFYIVENKIAVNLNEIHIYTITLCKVHKMRTIIYLHLIALCETI